MNEIIAFNKDKLETAVSFAKMIANTEFVPTNFRGKPDSILAAVIYGAEIGLHPLQALQNIGVINGKPDIYGDAALALVSSHKDFEDIKEYFQDKEKTIAVCEIKRKNRTVVIRNFCIEDAKKAGLFNRPVWQSYQSRMLQMRARGFALRDCFPDVLKGLITKEEAEDYPESDQIINNQSAPPCTIPFTEDEEIVENSTEDIVIEHSFNDKSKILNDIQYLIDEDENNFEVTYNLKNRAAKYISTKFNKNDFEELTIPELKEVYKRLKNIKK